MSETLHEAPVTAAAQVRTQKRRPEWLQDLGTKYALIGIWIVMALVFSVWVPNGLYHTSGTFHAIFGSVQATSLVMLALSAISTLAVGEFDLSFGSVMGCSASVISVLGGLHGWSPVLACLAGLTMALFAGLINAVFVVLFDVSSLVVTLGMGTVWVGLAEYITHSNYVAINSPGLRRFTTDSVLSMPLAFYYVIILAVIMAYVMARTPLGRSAVFVGANREVARLAGIRVNRIRFGSYILGAMFAGFAAIVIVGSVGSFDNSTTGTYLLPSLAAVFLGTAVVKPGAFNPIGAVIAIFFLQTGILGLQLLGATSWVQEVFYGGALVVAVAIARIVKARTGRA